MILLVWAVEGYIARHEDVVLPRVTRSWKASAGAAGSVAVGCDVLFFGDSQARLGLLPRVVEGRTGLSGYNLAVLRGMPASSYGLLKRALAAGARPKAVVVNFNPGLLASRPRLNAALWTRVLGPADAVALLARSRDPGLVVPTALAWIVPTWAVRAGVRDAVLAALGEGDDDSVRALREDRETRTTHLGALPLPENPKFTEPEAERAESATGRTWRCSRVNARYVREFVTLAEAHQARVFWVIPPMSPLLQAKRLRNGQEEAYSKFVSEIMAEHPNVVVVDGRRLRLDRASFVDPIHLSRRGADALSGVVADALASAQVLRRGRDADHGSAPRGLGARGSRSFR